MKRIALAIALSAAGAAVAASASQPAVDAYYHDMLSITHDANAAGETCMASLQKQQSTPACHLFEQRYERAVDQSQRLAARLKVAGQTLHRSDPRLAQLTRATEMLNRYMDSYQAQPSANDLRIMEESPR